MLRLLPAASLLLLVPADAASAAELRLPAVFSDGMVLQRESSAPIWGWADPGDQISLRGSWPGAAPVTAAADASGRWRAELATPAAGGPFSVEVTSGDETLELSDVLIGEVWLCSGQSNMEWTLDLILPAARRTEAVNERTANLDRAQVRFFDIPQTTAEAPREDCNARWWTASGDDSLRCSAVAYFFACALQDRLDIPIGLVVSAWGGTRAEAWTSEEVVQQFPYHAATLERIRNADPNQYASAVESFWERVDDSRYWTRSFPSADFDDEGWDVQVLPAHFESGPVGDHDGVVWYRRSVEVPSDWDAQELELVLSPIDDMDETFWNGVSIASTLAPGSHAQVRRYRVPAHLVTAGQAVIAVRAVDTGGPGGFAPRADAEGRAPIRLSFEGADLDLTGEWRVRRGAPVRSLPSVPAKQTTNQNTPAALFNGMIAPILPFGIRGAIWYQGESNRYRAEEYRELFPAMISDWRARWEAPELPFYFVQLAPYGYGGGDDGKTALVREAQARAARELPATGMALTADIGNARDIHPVNKWTVGERLALFALRDLYGFAGTLAEGPRLRRAVPAGGELSLEFDHVHGTLQSIGEQIDQFEVAGEDGVYAAAQARISADGQGIILSSPEVEAPVHARYLWNDAGYASVMGGAGLPMAPFRTR